MLLRYCSIQFYSCFKTGWGTRAGIGDVAVATAAIDNNEKAVGNGAVYQQRSEPYSNSQIPLSPFRDQAPSSPYQDNPIRVPIYTTRIGGNRRAEEGAEMQVGYAR